LLSLSIADRIQEWSFTMSLSSWLSGTFSHSHTRRGQRLNPASRSKKARFSLEPLEARALLASYTAAGVSDLIADITAANANGGTNTITLTAATTAPYVLTTVNNTTDGATGQPVIAANDNLTVVGAGDTIERSTAVGTPAFRLFDVAAGASLTLQSLTLQGGLATGAGVSAEGGAVYSQGALTLSGVTVQDNQAVGNAGSAGVSSSDPATPGGNAFGGGLYLAGGTATFTTATLSSNTALGGPGGSGSTSRNTGVGADGATGGYGFGGGLVIAGGTVALSGTTLSANVARGGPGGIGHDGPGGAGGNGFGGGLDVAGGTVTLSGGTLSSDGAQGGEGGSGDGYGYSGYGYGGALQLSGGMVRLTGTTLSLNTAQGRTGYGGALQVSSGAVSLTNATLSSNTAQGGNNAYIGGYGSGEDGIPYTLSEGGFGDGGALQVSGGAATLSGATLSSNTAQAGSGYYGGTANGGALQVSGGTVTLTSANLSSNTAQAGSGFGYGGAAHTAQGGNCSTGENGYAGNGDGGALQVIGGTVSVTNTTVSSNTAQGGTPGDDGGFGSGGGLYIKSPAIVYLDSFTVAHTSNNTDSTGLNGTSANFDGGYSVLNLDLQPPTVVNAAGASPSLVAGTTTSLSVLGSDPDNGSESYLNYTWAVTSAPAGAATPTFSSNGSNTSKNATATFHEAGTYTFTVTLSDSYHLTADSSVTVTVNQTETSISVSPTTASLDWGVSRQFTASARDQFGLAMAGQPAFIWTLAAGGAGGSLSASGLYTAPLASGTDTVRATDSSTNLSGTAAVTVMQAPPTVVTAASANPSPVTGTTTNLTVLGADAAGAASLTYTWAVTSAPAGAATPTFSSSGTNASQNTTAAFYLAGTYTFQATITDPSGLTAVSSVTVTVVQTVTSLSVTPGNVTLADKATQQFTATALDQFGNTLTSPPTFTWQVSSGGGTISRTGLYTAPRRGTGSFEVTVSADGLSAVADVNLVA
jgi:hypothetical protein